MKNTSVVALAAMSACILSFALPTKLVFADHHQDCSTMVGCDKKRCEISKQIIMAKAHGNSHKVAGLETALKNVETHCTTDALKQDLTAEIADVKQQIDKYQASLKEAEEERNLDKTYKYKQKLLSENTKLAELEQELASLEENK
ncbi:DUF1090 domain-containing protein [Shewanella sp. 1CM18E]|uniref:DUF1090 domain-containing protein n=1 Tax=Shewanella sp. 1CM18E TaxID=2929169 RepID=UPI0020C05161|nr:DUF1090 domain-containing protein [Shewanella sp. 1CM18E]MCK8045472.1 DUF1090 domain-containing protein [Shewanella sp. 1CM18E]